MFAVVAASWALFLGIGMMMLGNGLQASLLGIRATGEGFPTAVTGLVMSCYFFGFLAGSVLTPRVISTVGHIRVFSALASLASAAAVVHAVFVDPVTWGAMRFVTGFAYAGLFVVAESWPNDRATNQTRGQLLSFYMLVMLGGLVGGQGLLNGVEFCKDKATREPFDPQQGVTAAVVNRVFEKGVLIMPGSPGMIDGINGDHIAISPPFTINEEQVGEIAQVIADVVGEMERELGY